jgi:hypothetical protein
VMTPTGLVYLDRLDEILDAQVAKASTGANAERGSTRTPSRSAADAASQNEK